MTTAEFTCRTCRTKRTAPAEAVTLVLGPRPRYVVVCDHCGTTTDTPVHPDAVALLRHHVRVVVPTFTDTTDLTPDAVLALVDQIRALPEAHR